MALEGVKLRSDCGRWQVGSLWAVDLFGRPGQNQKVGSCKSVYKEVRGEREGSFKKVSCLGTSGPVFGQHTGSV